MSNLDEEIYNETLQDYHNFDDDGIMTIALLQDIFVLCACILGMIVNSVIVYCILVFKKMQTRTNICILNWAISSNMVLFTNAEVYSFMEGIFNLNFSSNLHCFVFDMMPAFLASGTLFMLLLGMDCVFFKCSPKCFKISLISIWTAVAIYIVTNTGLCLVRRSFVFILFIFIFLGCLLFICVRYCIFLKDVAFKKTTKEQTFRNILVGVLILSYIITISSFFVERFTYPSWWRLLFRMSIHADLFHPLVNAYLLMRLDENFKLCFTHIMKCSHNYIAATISYKQGMDDEDSLQACVNTVESDDV